MRTVSEPSDARDALNECRRLHNNCWQSNDSTCGDYSNLSGASVDRSFTIVTAEKLIVSLLFLTHNLIACTKVLLEAQEAKRLGTPDSIQMEYTQLT